MEQWKVGIERRDEGRSPRILELELPSGLEQEAKGVVLEREMMMSIIALLYSYLVIFPHNFNLLNGRRLVLFFSQHLVCSRYSINVFY